MKRTFCLFALFLLFPSVVLFADEPENEAYEFTVRMVNKRGRPYRDRKVFLYAAKEQKPVVLDNNGSCSLNVEPNDSIFIVFPSHGNIVPVNGLYSVEVYVQQDGLYIPNANNGKVPLKKTGIFYRSVRMTMKETRLLRDTGARFNWPGGTIRWEK